MFFKNDLSSARISAKSPVHRNAELTFKPKNISHTCDKCCYRARRVSTNCLFFTASKFNYYINRARAGRVTGRPKHLVVRLSRGPSRVSPTPWMGCTSEGFYRYLPVNRPGRGSSETHRRHIGRDGKRFEFGPERNRVSCLSSKRFWLCWFLPVSPARKHREGVFVRAENTMADETTA